MIPTTDEIISRIESEGYCVVSDFVSRETLQQFMPEVYRRFDRQSFNGTIGHIRFANQKYLQHTLAVHEEILKLFLHPLVVACSERYVGSDVHLQDYRIYQNLEGGKMAWHVDNKQTLEDLSSQMLENRGLIAIVYLEDVNHGPFEFVRLSHQWAWKEKRENWNDSFEEFRKDVITFNHLPAGTLILYDFRGIHRAQPFMKGSPRTAMFAQYAGLDWPTGEPIVLDASMLGNLSPKDKCVLRFGRKASSPTWPIPTDAEQRPPVPALISWVAHKMKRMTVSQSVFGV
jgi:ectoine hydroxylase-related dioxygenase (phytanoyl-CoA dioxygenase family)